MALGNSNSAAYSKFLQLVQQQAQGSGMGGLLGNPWGGSEEVQKHQQEEKRKVIASMVGKLDKLRTAEPELIRARIPDVIGTMTAWRGWKVSGDKLVSLGSSGSWEPKQAKRAECSKLSALGERTGHAAPHKGCSCGYWSFKSMDLLQRALEPYASSVVVVGSIEIWGKVIECTNGYRSEYAYPKELWLLNDDLEHLSWVYGVPVRRLLAAEG